MKYILPFIETGWAEDSEFCKLLEEPEYAIHILDAAESSTEGKRSKTIIVSSSSTLKWIAMTYSRRIGVPLKSIMRFTFEGRNLFISSTGKRPAKALGLKDGSVLVVSCSQVPIAKGTLKPDSRNKVQSKRNPSKHSSRKKSNTKKKNVLANSYSISSEEEEQKQQHSKALSQVFGECTSRFKEIRMKLDAMNLDRMPPKSKKVQPRSVVNPPMSSTQSLAGLGEKAGKSHFTINVGEAQNLYKTSKSWPTRQAFTIDLHGYTKEETLVKLDRNLPKWVDTAMQGKYPWVISGKIICGGGGQVLSEVVEKWIKRNEHVAKAPDKSK